MSARIACIALGLLLAGCLPKAVNTISVRRDGTIALCLDRKGEFRWLPQTKKDSSTPNDLYLTDRRGHRLRRLTRTELVKGWVRWSPSGKQLLYTAFDPKRGIGSLRLIDSSGKQRRILWQGKDSVMFPQWSPDGTRISFNLIQDKKQTLIFLDVASGKRLGRAEGEWTVSNSFWVHRALYPLQTHSGIGLLDPVRPNSLLALAHTKRVMFGHFEPLADGRYLALSQTPPRSADGTLDLRSEVKLDDKPGTLYLFGPGDTVRKVTDRVLGWSSMRLVSPDGRRLLAVRQLGKRELEDSELVLFDTAGKQPRRRLFRAPGLISPFWIDAQTVGLLEENKQQSKRRIWIFDLSPPAETPAAVRSVARLVPELAARAYRRRVEASRKLVKLGPAALTALSRHRFHPDLEVRSRVKKIISQIRDGRRFDLSAALRQRFQQQQAK